MKKVMIILGFGSLFFMSCGEFQEQEAFVNSASVDVTLEYTQKLESCMNSYYGKTFDTGWKGSSFVGKSYGSLLGNPTFSGKIYLEKYVNPVNGEKSNMYFSSYSITYSWNAYSRAYKQFYVAKDWQWGESGAGHHTPGKIILNLDAGENTNFVMKAKYSLNHVNDRPNNYTAQNLSPYFKNMIYDCAKKVFGNVL